MKTLTNAFTLTLAAISLTTVSFAAPAKPVPAKTTALICPVSGTKIASAAKAYNHETYKGKTYYFCCPECKPAFDKNPTKIIADSAHGKYQKM